MLIHLKLALDLLNARTLPDGRYAYRDSATGSDWAVTA